jgi:hypothetical protein
MHKFLRSGRGRYALACLVAVGGLVTAAASCQPAPTKEEPAPTGLSIAPESHNFGETMNTAQTFTVTNQGPDTSGTLVVQLQGGDEDAFDIVDDTCTGQTLALDGTCTVGASFFADGASGGRGTSLVVSSDIAADGEAVAALTGTVP